MIRKALFLLLLTLLFCPALCACRDSVGAFYPAVAHDPVSGRYLTVYLKVKSRGSDAVGWGESSLYGVFIDSSGVVQGNEFLIAGTGYYYSPSLVFDPVHLQYFVIWNEENKILGQFVTSDGRLTGGKFILSDTASTQSCTAVTYAAAAQKFIAAWGEVGASYHDGIYAQMINPDGSFDGPTMTVSDNGALPARPSIAFDEFSNRFLVVWNSTDDLGIKGRMINPDGTFAADEFLIAGTTGSYFAPAVIYSSVDERYLVSWEHGTDDCTYDLQGQLLNVDGTQYQSLINISSAGRNAYNHSSAYNAYNNTFFIVFGDYSRDTLYAQIVKSDGTLDTSIANDNILVSYAEYPHDSRPALAYDGIHNQYYSVWQYGAGDSSLAYPDIHGRLINADGTPAGDISVVANGGVQ